MNIEILDCDLDRLAFELALLVWECWHGPMAKMPATHAEAATDLKDMLSRAIERCNQE